MNMLEYSIERYSVPEGKIGAFDSFQFATVAGPPASSFYIALGLAMIKLMNRSQVLKSYHKPFEKRILTKLSNCMEILENWVPFSIAINRFKNLITQASEGYIKRFSEFIAENVNSKNRDFIEACDLGARALIIISMTEKTEEIKKIMNFDPFDLETEERYLINLVGAIGIKIRIIMDDDYKDFSYSSQEELLIVLHKHSNGQYFDLTHTLMTQIDTRESCPMNSNGFPFFLANTYVRGNPRRHSRVRIMPTFEDYSNKIQASEGDAQVLLNLIRKLATFIIYDMNNTDELVEVIDKAIHEFSVLNNGDLLKLKQKIQPDGSITTKNTICYHARSKYFKTDCGFTHCLECFRDKIEWAISKCPCKIEIKKENRVNIISYLAPMSITMKNAHDRAYPNPHESSNKLIPENPGGVKQPPLGDNRFSDHASRNQNIVSNNLPPPSPFPLGGNPANNFLPPLPEGNPANNYPSPDRKGIAENLLLPRVNTASNFPSPRFPPGGNPANNFPSPGRKEVPGNLPPPGGNPANNFPSPGRKEVPGNLPPPGGNPANNFPPPPPRVNTASNFPSPGRKEVPGNLPPPGGNSANNFPPPPFPPGGNPANIFQPPPPGGNPANNFPSPPFPPGGNPANNFPPPPFPPGGNPANIFQPPPHRVNPANNFPPPPFPPGGNPANIFQPPPPRVNPANNFPPPPFPPGGNPANNFPPPGGKEVPGIFISPLLTPVPPRGPPPFPPRVNTARNFPSPLKDNKRSNPPNPYIRKR